MCKGTQNFRRGEETEPLLSNPYPATSRYTSSLQTCIQTLYNVDKLSNLQGTNKRPSN